jgi:hypothetical protein
MPVGPLEIISGVGALGSALAGSGAREKQKQAQGIANKVARTQLQFYRDYGVPNSKTATEYYFQRAGLGTPVQLSAPDKHGHQTVISGGPGSAGNFGYVNPQQYAGGGGPLSQALGGGSGIRNVGGEASTYGGLPPIRNDASMGIYNSPQYQALRMQAEENAARQRDRAAAQFGYRFNQQGVNSGALAAALGRTYGSYSNNLANFERNLAIQAPDYQDRLVAQANASLGPALGSGVPAAGTALNLAQMYGQQAAGADASLAGILSQYLQLAAMRQAGTPPIAGSAYDNYMATRPIWPGTEVSTPGVLY